MFGKLIPSLAQPAADDLDLSMIEAAKAGSALRTAKNDCVSSVRRIGCGPASAIKVEVWPEKSSCVAPVLASLFANPATKRSVSFKTNRYALSPLSSSRGERAVSER